MLDVGTFDVATLDSLDVQTFGRSDVRTLDVGRWTLDIGSWWTLVDIGGRWTFDVIMRTVTNHAMLTHDHLCSPTNFVGNCSSDFVIIGHVLKATIEWRVFLKMTRQVYLFVRVFAFVFLYLNTIMKSQRHSTCLSLRRCGCLRVSVCPSFPVCVCFCLSLCVRLSLFVSVSVSVCQSVCLSVCRSVCLSVCRSVCLSVSVCLGLVRVAKKCMLVCLSVPAIPSPLTTTQSEEKAPWMTMDDEARDENNTQDCGCCGLQTL